MPRRGAVVIGVLVEVPEIIWSLSHLHVACRV